MSRKRDYKAEYAQRVRGVPVGQRSEARGHSGPIRRFLRDLGDGDLISCDVQKAIDTWDEKAEVYGVVDKWVINFHGGESSVYRLRRVSLERMAQLIEEEEAKGAMLSPIGSLDQRHLLEAPE